MLAIDKKKRKVAVFQKRLTLGVQTTFIVYLKKTTECFLMSIQFQIYWHEKVQRHLRVSNDHAHSIRIAT